MRIVLLVLALCATAYAGDARKVSFYVVAHEDDWQLFMNPSAFEDVAGGAAATVFIHVTAGDDGMGTGTGGRKQPYYLARENGAVSAIRLMVGTDWHPPVDGASGWVTLNGHAIYRASYGSATAYFLRLPDGNGSGAGYKATGYQSLERLAHGDIATISAVDGSTVYHGWSDLVATMKEIVDHERAGATLIQLDVADPNAKLNAGDHSDHRMAAKAALDAAKDLACVRRMYFVEYATSKLPPNLKPFERDMQSAAYAATVAGELAFDHAMSWQHYDELFVGRSYFRVEEPAARCSMAVTAR